MSQDIEDFRPQIDAALIYAGGTHLFEDVKGMVEREECQFWPGVDSCVITQIHFEPRRRILNIFLAGGDLAEIEAMTPLILQWGYEQGCTVAAFTGRRGWERTFLTRTGWTPEMTMFAKELGAAEYGKERER